MNVFVTGGDGQLGRALQEIFDGTFTDYKTVNIADKAAVEALDLSDYDAIINAAAFTNVDGAELPENKDIAWAVNAEAVGHLAEAANKYDIPLVHVSTEYVFDGKKSDPYNETDSPSPLSEYGRSKAAGEEQAMRANKGYILRTSWVVGEGHNFAMTMLTLSEKLKTLSIVGDQIGRPTFTPVLARAISHLLETKADFGIYNVTNGGDPVSWADFARAIFDVAQTGTTVTDTTTAAYFADKPQAATRPLNSVLSLEKATAAGVATPDWRSSLREYIERTTS